MTDRKSGPTAEAEQRRAWAALSPAQRLAWLWQAKLFARRALDAAARRRRGERH